MSKASSAGLLKMSLELSGATGSPGTFRSARRCAAAACLALFAPLAFAAPFNYVANSSCTIGSTNYSGCVTVLDVSLPTNQIVATIPQRTDATSTTPAKPGIGAGPIGIAMNSGGTRVYVVNYGDSTDLKTPGTVSVIDSDPASASLNTVIATITVGIRPQLIAINPAGTTAYVTNSVGNSVSVVDTATNKETAKITVGGVPIGIAFTPDGKKAYVTLADKSRVAVIDATSNTVANSTIALTTSNPVGVVVGPAGKFAYVANYGRADGGLPGTVSVIDVSKDSEVVSIPVGVGPIGIAISPDGSNVYVTNSTSNSVSVVDTATNKATAEIPVGAGPLGITVDSNGALAYVNNIGGNSVSVVDLGLNVLRSSMNSGGSGPNYGALTTSAGLSVNLNQRGLSGAWYSPSVSGQGLILESAPDVGGAGHGRLFAGWFTFDVTAAGGQRWYALQGDVSSTDTAAALTIYAGTGGNFNAGPAVASIPVGQATLQFTDCSHGILRYTFNDGSNRKGFVTLDRLTGGATCTPVGDSGPVSGNDGFSGSWYSPDTSGQGIVLNTYTKDNMVSLFGGWFTYAPNGQQIGGGASQRWYALQTDPETPVQGNSYRVSIAERSGGVFMTAPNSAETSLSAGSATLVFTSCTTMSLAYNFTDGTNKSLSNTMNLVRLGPPPAGCL